MVRWDTPVKAFDHRRAGYTLEGRHAALVCRDCHKPGFISAATRETLSAKDLSRTYLGLSTKCLGCHLDEHRGQLSAECANCHDPSKWKIAGQFDHKRARFSLTGGHEKVACEKCHTRVEDPKPYVRYKPIAFEDCAPCHKDPHGGAFHASCRSCHASAISWKPTDVATVFNHSQTRYPLEGKHAALPCQSCHQRGGFKEPVAFAHCSDCHKKDPHRGQFADRADGGDCSPCHKVNGFKPSTFGVAQHGESRYPLKARHAQVPCAKCHAPNVNGVVYRIQDTSCAACHRDVHGGQFRKAPYDNRCEACHTERGFKPSTFTLAQHSATRYPLAGAHAAVICDECHRRDLAGGEAQPVRFRFDDRSCTTCHEDPHRGQFASRMAVVLRDGSRVGCSACHTTKAWEELHGFDHATTDFPLEGSHRAVQCSQCHKSDNLTAEMKDVVFKSAPRQCAGCHDDIHAGQFASGSQAPDCGKCHRELKWKPSTFNHDTQSTYKLDGAHRNVRCALCHRTTREVAGKTVVFYKPTVRQCSGCHGSDIAGK